MKKRENNSVIQRILHQYMHEFFSFLFSSLENGIEDSVEKFSNFLHIKRKLKTYTNAMVMMTASLVLIFFGIGTLLASYFPSWTPGLSHLIVGIIFLAGAWMYKKYG